MKLYPHLNLEHSCTPSFNLKTVLKLLPIPVNPEKETCGLSRLATEHFK